jgi:hypothetical protein
VPKLLALALTMLLLTGAQAFAQDEEGTRTPSGLLPEPRILRKALSFAAQMKSDNGTANEGLYPEMGQMITGAGWISGGPGYRRRLFDDRLLVEASASVSWRFYKVAQARVEAPALARKRLALGGQVLWRDLTQVSYYGTGPDSREDRRSDYRMQLSNVVGYATVRADDALAVTGSAGWISRPGISSSTGFFDRDLPDTTVLFAHDPAAGIERHPSFFHADVALTRDTRDHPGHPTRGSLYRGRVATFNDRHHDRYTFGRYEAEGVHFIPVARTRLVLALRGLGVFTAARPTRIVPFYLLPSLGGHNTLRGYADYRFHDRHLVVANVESRFPVMTHLDGALFFDAGNVAADIDELNLDRTSWGAGVRLHTGTSTLARLDVGRSHEGWQVQFRLTDPLRLARLSRQAAAMPFVP